jgi:ABC-type methionine transport system permease subunit
LTRNLLNKKQIHKIIGDEMTKTVPLLLLLILLASALLLIISSSFSTAAAPSPFLIAATIVSSVALFGALFSLYAEKRAKTRIQRDFIHKH